MTVDLSRLGEGFEDSSCKLDPLEWSSDECFDMLDLMIKADCSQDVHATELSMAKVLSELEVIRESFRELLDVVAEVAEFVLEILEKELSGICGMVFAFIVWSGIDCVKLELTVFLADDECTLEAEIGHQVV